MSTDPKVYEPFPPGEVPRGWPKEYVSLAAYRRLRIKLKKARAELKEVYGPRGGYLFDGDMD